jgi:hypothetical protein
MPTLGKMKLRSYTAWFAHLVSHASFQMCITGGKWRRRAALQERGIC